MSATGEKRLRLRLRVVDSPARAKVDVPASCTLEQLKPAVRAQLHGLDAGFGISLNKKAALSDADAKLTSLGICSGDLLWVQSSSGAAATECEVAAPGSSAAAAPASALHAAQAAAMLAPRPLPPRQAAGNAAEARHQAAMQAAAKVAPAQSSPSGAHDVPDTLPVRASRLGVIRTDGGIMQLAAALHAIALDCGLQGIDASQAQTEDLPVASQPSANSISLRYRLAGITSIAMPVAVATLQCSRLGRHAVVAGRVAAPGGGAAASAAHHVSLPWQPRDAAAAAAADCGMDASSMRNTDPMPMDTAVDAAAAGAAAADTAAAAGAAAAAEARIPLDALLAENVAEFVTAAKDGVLLPLVADLCRAAGVAPPFGLLSLPSELRRSVMGLLGAKDLAQLACVCAELQDAASANDLWRALFEAEFGEASLAEATAGARGWKSLFNRRWANREEYRSARRRPMRFPHMPPPANPLRPFGCRNPPGMPFIIGGDRDRLPLPFQPFEGRGGRGGRGGSGNIFGGSHFY